MKKFALAIALGAFVLGAFATNEAQANPARDAILAAFANTAKVENSAFAGFNARAGETLFTSKHSGGKPETPSCTTCHGASPQASGETRAGKVIDPMAVSRNASRYTDTEKVDKWFFRNCRSVLGRECTAQQKGDYLTFMISQ
jgi:mono/diheme cytochrome c family protein